MSKTENKTKGLSQDAILSAEFEYIAQSTFQANEDRSRVINIYMLTLGSVLAGIYSSGSQVSNITSSNTFNVVFGILSLLLAFQGTMTLLQLARLRGAWFESVKALNQIKSYYTERFPNIDKAFRWNEHNVPARFKPNSIGFMFALQVILLTSFSLAAAFVAFTVTILPPTTTIISGIVIIVLTVVILIGLFKKIMEKM